MSPESPWLPAPAPTPRPRWPPRIPRARPPVSWAGKQCKPPRLTTTARWELGTATNKLSQSHIYMLGLSGPFACLLLHVCIRPSGRHAPVIPAVPGRRTRAGLTRRRPGNCARRITRMNYLPLTWTRAHSIHTPVFDGNSTVLHVKLFKV